MPKTIAMVPVNLEMQKNQQIVQITLTRYLISVVLGISLNMMQLFAHQNGNARHLENSSSTPKTIVMVPANLEMQINRQIVQITLTRY